jgi:hypothetical protein
VRKSPKSIRPSPATRAFGRAKPPLEVLLFPASRIGNRAEKPKEH